MGNRAVVTILDDSKIGVYLHWNGGVESVLAFAHCARDLGIRNPINDPAYFISRFTQMVGNFFGDSLSLGVGLTENLDDSDNGRFYLTEKFEIGKRNQSGVKTLDKFSLEKREYYRNVYNECMRANYKVFGVPKKFIKKSEIK